MIAYGNEAEVVAREEELGNLAAPVRQMFAQPDHAADDLVGVVYRLALAEDRLVLDNVNVTTDPIQGLQLVVCDGGRFIAITACCRRSARLRSGGRHYVSLPWMLRL
jgi:hypothetical protein